CPAEAISEGEDKYVIDPKLCMDCGTCAEQCPVEAITPGEEK
ncbi:MAG: 4Fe-4S binding protein, partial [Thermodesulfobacteriota bacterium]